MLFIDENATDRPDLQAAYSDGSLELLRELVPAIDLDSALPRLSVTARKVLYDALAHGVR